MVALIFKQTNAFCGGYQLQIISFDAGAAYRRKDTTTLTAFGNDKPLQLYLINKTNLPTNVTEHCTQVCRFMKPVTPSCHASYQVPEIAVQ